MPQATLKTLDDILKYLRDNTDEKPIDLDFVLLNWSPPLSNRDKRAIQEKLRRDNFIDETIPNPKGTTNANPLYDEDKKYQFITFEGLLLLDEENGYEGRRKKRRGKDWWDWVLKIFVILSFLVSASALYVNYNANAKPKPSIQVECIPCK